MKRLAFASLFIAAAAAAQPAPGSAPTGDKVDAKQLMQTGVRLLEAKDYLGALAIFRDAYERFPSAKILLNIGTTLKLLDKKAEAANAYQHYLDSPDTDAARRSQVTDELTELDRSLGVVAVTVDPKDSELQIDDSWMKGARTLHLDPGKSTLHVRHDGYQPGERVVEVTAGQHLETAIALELVPKPVVQKEIITVPRDELPSADLGPRSRIGALAMAHVSVTPKLGSAWMVGATGDVTEQLAIDAALILGPGLVSSQGDYMYAPPKLGLYAGASFAFLTGTLRPRVSAGLPMFFSDGVRIAARGAGGIEYVASRRWSFVIELGVERNLNKQTDIDATAFVPALAATGRL